MAVHGSTQIEWANQRFTLLADRAAYWHTRRTLLIADPHFGKADHFRRSGVPVPWGTTDANLARLDRLLDATQADRLLVLGDLFHAKEGLTEPMLDRLNAWRQRRDRLSVQVVRGNHDRRAGLPPDALRFEDLGDVLVEDGLAFRHEPEPVEDKHVLAGHVHPAVSLRPAAGRGPGMHAACFHFAPRLALLPAFGAFTGTHCIHPRAGDRVFAVGPDCVCEVPGVRR